MSDRPLPAPGSRPLPERAEVPLDKLYREVVLDHHRRPRGREPLPRCDASARGFNPVCGDEVEIRLALEGERVSGVQVSGRGCAVCTASGSMLAELVPGLPSADVQRLADSFRGLMHGHVPPPDVDLGDLEALSGVAHFPVRVKCAMLPWVTLEQALRSGASEPGPSAVSTEGEEP